MKTAEEKIELIKKFSNWFYQNTSSFEGELGLQLAYLWPAIASDGAIEVESTSEIVRLLIVNQEPEEWENGGIWEYLSLIHPAELEEEYEALWSAIKYLFTAAWTYDSENEVWVQNCGKCTRGTTKLALQEMAENDPEGAKPLLERFA